MTNTRRIAGTIAAGAMIATPLALAAPSPAHAADREFRVGGASVDFSVEKDDGRFEVDVDLDDAKPGSRWRITLKQDGKTFYNQVRSADGEGDIEIGRDRADTAGRDVFKVVVKKIGGAKKSATIRMR